MGETCSTCNFLSGDQFERKMDRESKVTKPEYHSNRNPDKDNKMPKVTVPFGVSDQSPVNDAPIKENSKKENPFLDNDDSFGALPHKSGTKEEKEKAWRLIFDILKGYITRKMFVVKAEEKKAAALPEIKPATSQIIAADSTYPKAGLSQEAGVTKVVNFAIQKQDGGVYTGEMLNGKRQGHGTCIWADGAKYTGSWSNDMREGRGTMEFVGGTIIEGNWKKNNTQGIVKLTKADGEYWEGEMVNEEYQGMCTHITADKTKYYGNMQHSMKEGKGRLEFPSGKVYEGEFHENKMHGQGKLISPDGAVYEGGFVNDLKEGDGVYMWSDGRKYEGTFSSGKQHGIGFYTSKDGVKKKGQWDNGKRIEWIT